MSAGSARHASRSEKARAPVRSVEAFDPDHGACVWRMHEGAGLGDDSNVRRAGTRRGKEDQIAAGDVVSTNPDSRLILLGRGTRQHDAVLIEHVLDEPAAVEALLRTRTTELVSDATLKERGIEQGRPRGRRQCGPGRRRPESAR